MTRACVELALGSLDSGTQLVPDLLAQQQAMLVSTSSTGAWLRPPPALSLSLSLSFCARVCEAVGLLN